jgi:hypothetical protein
LRYRTYDLFGYCPDTAPRPVKPVDYDGLAWADPLQPIANVEQVLRAAMRTKRKDRVVACARELGWLFSEFKPDPTL